METALEAALLRRYLHDLDDTNLPMAQRTMALRQLHAFTFASSPIYQQLVLQPHVVRAVVGVLCDNPEEEELLEVGFDCLAQMSFTDHNTRQIAGSDPAFLMSCQHVLHRKPALRAHCLDTVRNVVWQASPEVHAALLALVPSMLGLLRDGPHEPIIQGLVCTVLQNFTLDTASRPALVANGCIPALARALRQHHAQDEGGLPEGGDVCAVAALARLLHLSPDEEAMGLLQDERVLSPVVDCFNNTLLGNDYPEDTGIFWDGWEIASAITALSQLRQVRPLLQQRSELPGLLALALRCAHRTDNDQSSAPSKELSNALLVKSSLQALWRLSSE